MLRNGVRNHRLPPVLCLCFAEDPRSPAERVEQVQLVVGHNGLNQQVIPGKEHATLTDDRATAKERQVDTLGLLLKQLRRLKP